MKENEKRKACPHNNAAYCYPSERKCESCGWNPKVSKSRLEEIVEKRKVEAKALGAKSTKKR